MDRRVVSRPSILFEGKEQEAERSIVHASWRSVLVSSDVSLEKLLYRDRRDSSSHHVALCRSLLLVADEETDSDSRYENRCEISRDNVDPFRNGLPIQLFCWQT